MASISNERAGKLAESDAHSIDERTLCGDDERSDHGRPSSEVSEGEHDILESEDERERLLTKPDGIRGLFSNTKVHVGKRNVKTHNAGKRRQPQSEETSALMYEMEEGVGTSSSSLRSPSSDSNEPRSLAATQRKVGLNQLSAILGSLTVCSRGGSVGGA
jgi:hypothetical protein